MKDRDQVHYQMRLLGSSRLLRVPETEDSVWPWSSTMELYTLEKLYINHGTSARIPSQPFILATALFPSRKSWARLFSVMPPEVAQSNLMLLRMQVEKAPPPSFFFFFVALHRKFCSRFIKFSGNQEKELLSVFGKKWNLIISFWRLRYENCADGQSLCASSSQLTIPLSWSCHYQNGQTFGL